MALQSKYHQYLSRPNVDAFAPGASLVYVPTSVTITGPAAIIKHHSAQEQQLKRKENFLNVVEGSSSICVESETTILFDGGGGTYLPGLDENFLIDRTVSLPIMHVVTFDNNQKIEQIRLMWDQGCLLKSVDVVGARGKNWPIREGKEQLRAITSSIESSTITSMATGAPGDERQGRRPTKAGTANAGSGTPPSWSRSIERDESPNNALGPRASAKPPPRDYHDLFAADADLAPERSQSPSKNNPKKAGAGKNYHDVRLFDNTPLDPRDPSSPEKISIKANPRKHNHFEFGEDPLNVQPNTDKASKHRSQWDFSDFVTPEKSRSRQATRTDRHFGWSDDEDEAKQPTIHRQQKPHPRKDADAHFDFNDDATPKATAPERPRTRDANDRMGLYHDHVNLGDPEKQAGASLNEKMPLGNVTNVNAQGHKKNFSSQFEMSDASPNILKDENANRELPETKKKATKIMEANWSMYDDSPPVEKHKGINIQGDGMGSRKGVEKPWWEFE